MNWGGGGVACSGRAKVVCGACLFPLFFGLFVRLAALDDMNDMPECGKVGGTGLLGGDRL